MRSLSVNLLFTKYKGENYWGLELVWCGVWCGEGCLRIFMLCIFVVCLWSVCLIREPFLSLMKTTRLHVWCYKWYRAWCLFWQNVWWISTFSTLKKTKGIVYVANTGSSWVKCSRQIYQSFTRIIITTTCMLSSFILSIKAYVDFNWKKYWSLEVEWPNFNTQPNMS